MCYVVAKAVDGIGCVALKTSHGEGLVQLKQRIIAQVGIERIQLVTISRPSAYGEYAPYVFVHSEEEFERATLEI